jgi:hypothetical protein
MPAKHTIREILLAETLPEDSSDTRFVLEELASELGMDVDIPYDLSNADIFPYQVDIKGSCQYDHRRGAILYVLSYEGEVVSIGSFAGRELSDVSRIYIYDNENLTDLIFRFLDKPSRVDDSFNSDEIIDVVYWEGTPIRLGEHRVGID